MLTGRKAMATDEGGAVLTGRDKRKATKKCRVCGKRAPVYVSQYPPGALRFAPHEVETGLPFLNGVECRPGRWCSGAYAKVKPDGKEGKPWAASTMSQTKASAWMGSGMPIAMPGAIPATGTATNGRRRLAEGEADRNVTDHLEDCAGGKAE